MSSSDTPVLPDITPPKPPSLKPPSVHITPPAALPVVPAAPSAPTPEPAAVVTPPAVVAEPSKVEPARLRVIKGFSFPANGITVFFKAGFIVEDPALAKQMLDCGVPVQLLTDKQVNVCPNCKHVFPKE